MASGTDMLSSDDRIDIELDATLKFYKVVNCIEKWQTASCQIPDDIYEADSEDYVSEAESLQSILTNAYLHLEASVVCEVSSAAKNMKATLMEELTYEIKYLQSITLKKTDVESTDVPSEVTELSNIETVLPVCITELSTAYPDSTEQISLALHAVDPFSSTVTDSHKTKLLAQFVSTDSTTVTRCSAVHQECHSTFKPQIIEEAPSALQYHAEEQPTDETVSTNQVVRSSVSTSVETDCHNDTTTAVSNATSVHRTPAITVDEETIDCAITRYDEATTIMTEQTFTATEASSAYTACTEQLNKALPAADAPVCVQEHATELQTQVPTKDPATTRPQSTMPYNSESKSTSQISTDTEGHIIYHSKFWNHPNDIYDNQKTPEYVGIVQSCHSGYSSEILYILLYS